MGDERNDAEPLSGNWNPTGSIGLAGILQRDKQHLVRPVQDLLDSPS